MHAYTSQMKLAKLSQTFSPRKEEKEYFEILDQYIDCLFHINDEVLIKNIRNLSMFNFQQKNVEGVYTEFFMQFHTQDNTWLANYMRMRLAFFKAAMVDHNLNIPLATIKKYMSTSKLFKQKRDAYEQAMTKAYIIARKDDQEVFNVTTEKLKEERNAVYYNHLFRNGVVKSMKILGLDQNNIEAGLELNRNLWLTPTRLQSFNKIVGNEKITEMLNQQPTKDNSHLVNEFEKTNQEMFTIWNTLCDTEYYHENKKIIDHLGIVTPEMQLTNSKKKELNKEMFNISSLRQKIVDELLATYEQTNI